MAISPVFVILPVLFILPNYIDYANPDTIFYIRIIFGVVHATLFLIALYMQNVIKQKPNNAVVVIPPAAPGFLARLTGAQEAPAEERRLTVSEYDAEEISNYMTGMLKTLAIICFLHFKMGVVPPLLVQCITNSFSLFQGSLFAIHVLGSTDPEVLKRPFKTGAPEAPAANAATTPTTTIPDDSDDEAEEEEEETDGGAEKKQPSKKKKQAAKKESKKQK